MSKDDSGTITLSNNAYFSVEGLKAWLESMTVFYLSGKPIINDNEFFMVQDKDTGDMYEIRKVFKEKE